MKVYGIARSQRLQIDECRIPAAGFPFAASRKNSVLSNLSRLTPTKDHHANPQRPSCVLPCFRPLSLRLVCLRNRRHPHHLLPQNPAQHPPHPPPPHSSPPPTSSAAPPPPPRPSSPSSNPSTTSSPKTSTSPPPAYPPPSASAPPPALPSP